MLSLSTEGGGVRVSISIRKQVYEKLVKVKEELGATSLSDTINMLIEIYKSCKEKKGD